MNVLIVDDDKLFIRKAVEGIDWEEIGIHRVFSAENMQQACTVLETFSVDIVVTDVEMVRGNGLELLSWIAEKKYPVETVVVSGYAHFSYVQKAMEYGCRRYLLKPVSGKELSGVLSEIIRQKKQSRPENQRHFTARWKEPPAGRDSGRSFLDELRERQETCASGDTFCIAVLRILTEQNRGETEQRLLMFVIRNVILGLMEESTVSLECIRQESQEEWTLLLRLPQGMEQINDELLRIRDYLKWTAQLTSCIYISSSGSPEQLISGYESFRRLCTEVVFEEQGLIRQSEWEEPAGEPVAPPGFDAMAEELSSGETASIRERLTEYIRALVDAHQATRDRFEELLNGMVRMVKSFIGQNGLSFYQLYDREQYEAECRKAVTSVQRMEGFVEYLVMKLDGSTEIGSKKKQLVELLKRYISEHISEELTRKKLAQSIHFSEDYVARLFKTETGKSISTYVMEQRMELAKRYIAESSMSISDVAMMVGYSNFSYFSKTFKDYTGKTPNEYRIYIKSSQF